MSMNCTRNFPSPRGALVLFAIALAGPLLAFAQQPPRLKQPQLVLLDGQVVPVQSLAIDGGKLSGEGVSAELTVDDLRRIELPPPAAIAAEKPAALIELRGGGRVPAKGVTIAEDKCLVAWPHGESLSLPIEAVRAIRFDPAATNADFDKALATPSAELDRLFLKLEGEKLESVTGLVVALSDKELTFEIEGANRTLAKDKIFGIVVAQPDAADAAPQASVEFGGGSVLGGEIAGLADGQLTLNISGGGKTVVPWSAVSRVIIRSSRVAFLSDLKPIAEEQQAIVTLPRPAQRNKSVTGKPLTLGPRTFEQGWGVHARSSLTFAAEQKYDVLAATIGIDAAAGGKGDCIFTVLADGQPVFTQRMRGSDPPRDIQVPLEGVEQVTLLVEPGAELDLADHADWCEVRFVRKR
jgi:hypothetical protein